MTHPIKSELASSKFLRESRIQHLWLTRIFNTIEIDQLKRSSEAKRRVLPLSSHAELIEKERKANEFLKTFCEACTYSNPYGADFCCKCGEPLSVGKSIL